MVEDVPSFQIRRIHYIVDQLKEQGQNVTEWLVRRKAGLKTNLDTKAENVLREHTE
ncbi:hypothetical protein [Paraliobacillus zengyii]|uniref:hypothetical protein n=1 Tax=Paraliobacillus zengyii TaxID=2213194 RepID=UPI0013A6B6A1|nr:hypothetical protein [Paraliobacillus zengyii]